MIICAFKKQMKHLLDLSYFEIDMSYKRVKDNINEIIFVNFVLKDNKSKLNV